METVNPMTPSEQVSAITAKELGSLATEMKYLNKSIEKIDKGLEDLNTKMNQSNDKLDGKYMSKEDFKTFVEGDFKNIRALVYGFVGLVLTAVVVAIVALVVVK